MKNNKQNQQNATVNNIYVPQLLKCFSQFDKQDLGLEAKTGFNVFDAEDRNLYGGIHEGLYILGAVSSLGKTSFCLQLADQISEHGQDVLFFSLEQSPYELLSKSISRHTYLIAKEQKKEDYKQLAKETAQILNKHRYNFYAPEEKHIISMAIKNYSTQAKHLYILPGQYQGKQLTVTDISNIVKEHISKTNNIPIVFIDYLQLLAMSNPTFRGTDKQAIDLITTSLKGVSRAFKTAVIAISSFNRESYNAPITLASFKESGAIEYSADIILGLEYGEINGPGMEHKKLETDKDYRIRITALKESNTQKKANKTPVTILLKCLKNRNGNTFSCNFNFLHAYNYFEEIKNDDDHFLFPVYPNSF